MQAVLPGRPQAKLYALSTALWDQKRIITYVTRHALIILGGPRDLLQSIDHDEEEELEACAIDSASGKIATCSRSTLYVYYPVHGSPDTPRWSLQQVLRPSCIDTALSTLSWGLPEEVLVSGSSLTLFSTSIPVKELWCQPLANDAKHAIFSHDASFIASTGRYDRLVKIWRRLFFGGESDRFDVSYLAHPAAVTHVQWRGRPATDHPEHSILYTVCADNKLRVWAGTDPHGLQALQLWAELDLEHCLGPQAPLSKHGRRHVMFVDSWDFPCLVDATSQAAKGTTYDEQIQENLKVVASKRAEVCLVLDHHGTMSAWGLARVGCKARQDEDVFNIANVTGLDLGFASDAHPQEDFLRLQCFADSTEDGTLCVLAHSFDGAIRYHGYNVQKLLDPASGVKRNHTQAMWTGHTRPIDSLGVSVRSLMFVSVADNEVMEWLVKPESGDFEICRRSLVTTDRLIRKALPLVEDGAIILLDSTELSLWTTSNGSARRVSSIVHGIPDTNNIIVMSFIWGDPDEEVVCLLDSTLMGSSWGIATATKSIKNLQGFRVGDYSLQTLVAAVDVPRSIQDGNMATRNLIVADGEGRLVLWSLAVGDHGRKVECLELAAVDTSMVEPSAVACTPQAKAAMVDSSRTGLAIWDVADALLEHSHQFASHEAIHEINWLVTESSLATLIVVLRQKIIVYSQMRFDLLGDEVSWQIIHEIDIAPLTNLPIVGTTWLGSNVLAVATGQPMFLYDLQTALRPTKTIKPDTLNDSPGVSDALPSTKLDSTELPIFHPQNITQYILAGRTTSVHNILCKLNDVLRYFTNGDSLSPFLDLDDPIELRQDSENGNGVDGDVSKHDQRTLDEKTALELRERLTEVKIPQLSVNEQSILARLVNGIGATGRQLGSVDEAGLRYLTFLCYSHLQSGTTTTSELSWREIVWANLSNTQDILVDLTSKQCNNRMQWGDARNCGMFMWLSDINAFRAQFEVVARNEYTRTDEKNPVDCTLYYLALKKKQILIGLWRMASWNKEQAATLRLLANNFADQRWKTAALKNAYALLGRRRFEYAASFFLLADHLKDAIGVLENQLNDMQLAIAVARVYEGDDGPVLRDLLVDKVLPNAVKLGNRWRAAWAFRMLGRHDMALRALSSPLLCTLIPGMTFGDPAAQHFLNREPSLATLYAHLRDEINPGSRQDVEAEREMVAYSAKMYNRMGCNGLARALVRDWKYSYSNAVAADPATDGSSHGENGGDGETGRDEVQDAAQAEAEEESEIEDDAEEADEQETVKSQLPAGLVADSKPRIKVLEEPSASSIFDNFDF